MSKTPKTSAPSHVEVEYIESGAFQGGEEDVFTAGIKSGEECVVLTKKNFDLMMVADGELKSEINRLKAVVLNQQRQIDELNQAAIDGEANI